MYLLSHFLPLPAAGEDDEVLYPNHMVVVKEEASAATKTEMVEVKEAGVGEVYYRWTLNNVVKG